MSSDKQAFGQGNMDMRKVAEAEDRYESVACGTPYGARTVEQELRNQKAVMGAELSNARQEIRDLKRLVRSLPSLVFNVPATPLQFVGWVQNDADGSPKVRTGTILNVGARFVEVHCDQTSSTMFMEPSRLYALKGELPETSPEDSEFWDWLVREVGNVTVPKETTP